MDAKPLDFIYHVTCLFTWARLDDAACKCKKLESQDYPCAHIFCVLDHLGVRTFPNKLWRKDGQCMPSQRSLLRGLRILMYGLITWISIINYATWLVTLYSQPQLAIHSQNRWWSSSGVYWWMEKKLIWMKARNVCSFADILLCYSRMLHWWHGKSNQNSSKRETNYRRIEQED